MARYNFSKSLMEVRGSDGDLVKALNDNKANISFKTPSKVSSHIKPKSATKLKNMLNEKSGDRYIPNRNTTDIGKLQFDFSLNETQTSSTMAECENRNILHFSSGLPFNRKVSPKKKCSDIQIQESKSVDRVLPSGPLKVLDAPNLEPIFYLNLIDWSKEAIIAVGLGNEAYLWNSTNGVTSKLMSTEFIDEKITSVKWSPDATDVLAIGTSIGRVQLWNASTIGLIRTMNMNEASRNRIATVAWLEHILTAGAFTGSLIHNDIRMANHEISTRKAHTQEVVGLSWSPDKRMLASGGNDNKVCIWDADLTQGTTAEPLHKLNDHTSAVKALAWCPWKPNLLVTGGGSADHNLKFWNASTAALVKSIDVESQVSGIVWSQDHREILTSHGSGNNLLRLWKYPKVDLVCNLPTINSGRILSMCASPDNEYVACLESEQSIAIWHPFPVDPNKKKLQTQNLNTFTGSQIR